MNPAPARDAVRKARLWLLLAVAFGTLSLSGSASAQAAAAEAKESRKAKITFSPEGEAAFAEFVKKVAEAKRNLWDLRMKKEIGAVAKLTGLDAAGTKALETPAQQAAELCMEGWSAKFDEYFRKAYSRQPEQIVEILEQIIPQAENYANSNYLGEHPQPTEHAAWTEGVRRTLTAEQAAKWTEVQAERERVLRKEIGEFLKPSIERTREQHNETIRVKTAEIKRALTLPKERAEKLDALAKTVVDESAEEWRKRAQRVLFSTEDQQRLQLMKSGQFYLPTEGKDLPAQRPAWKEGLSKLLSGEEMTRLQNTSAERHQRQLTVMGQLMMAELDDKIAFTASQRQRLQPIVERLMNEHPGLVPDEAAESYINFAPQTFLALGAKATDQELQPILDPVQRKRWQEVCTARNPTRTVLTRLTVAKPTSGTETKAPAPSPDPEVFEHAISDFLHDKATRERKRVLATMMVKAEDAARAAGLTPETFGRLQTAARGATEELLAGWNSGTDQTIRGQLRDATAENVKQRLAGIQDYYLQRVAGAPLPNNQPVWETAVKGELTEQQRTAWQKEVDERSAYREKTIVSAMLVEFDRRNTLSTEQWAKLETIIARIMKEYGPDIAGMFSYSNSVPWYLQQHTMLMPFAGVPEKELKAILTPEQWEQWAGSDAFGNSTNYWENIRNNHAQRVKKGQ